MGDQRPTYIVWSFAPDGAGQYLDTTPFHPFRYKYTNGPLDNVQCGELDTPRKRNGAFDPIPGVDGSHVSGSAQDFAGQSVCPPLLPGGIFPPHLVPSCSDPPGWLRGAFSADRIGLAGWRRSASTWSTSSAHGLRRAFTWLPGVPSTRCGWARGASWTDGGVSLIVFYNRGATLDGIDGE